MERVEIMETLKDEVVKKLVTTHEFLLEDAETAVEESVRMRPDLWNENAESDDLANFLASDDDDD